MPYLHALERKVSKVAGMDLMVVMDHSVGEGALERAAIESLHANRIDSKFLYVTTRQTDLWRSVFLCHSPIQGNPEFARIYRDAFARAADKISASGHLSLIGLGCGTGKKEVEFCAQLKQRGFNVIFAAVDVSKDLVEESANQLSKAGALIHPCLVCDLVTTTYLTRWLEKTASELPRVFTFFGMVPNLAPSVVSRLLREILREDDVMLVSAHLAPVGEGAGLDSAMNKVLPQYDNAETLMWLSAALEEWGMKERVEAPEMKIGEIEGVPAFVATARWKSAEGFERWGQRFSPKVEEPLQLFHSLRYTPELFEKILGDAGFKSEIMAMTDCREEAIWSVQL